MNFSASDGGRKAAGYRSTRDCVCRALNVLTERGYFKIRTELAHVNELTAGRFSGGDGIHTSSLRFAEYMREQGFGERIEANMGLDDLPQGRLFVVIHRHAVAVIDHTMYDVGDIRQHWSPARCRVKYYWLLP